MFSPLLRMLVLVLSLIALDVHGGEKADRVLVIKKTKVLRLYNGDRLLASYPVVFGPRPTGHKRQEGDGRTPEGTYLLDFKKPDSAYHKAIHVSYPNEEDRRRAKARGVAPGGAIMIHGQKNYFGWATVATKRFNWTRGCIALSNKDMDAVWEAVDAGTPIEIKP
jgi:murein L,D-transpeptidase YafK